MGRLQPGALLRGSAPLPLRRAQPGQRELKAEGFLVVSKDMTGFYSNLIRFYSISIGFYSNLLGFYDKLIRLYSMLIGFYSNLRGFYSNLIRLYSMLTGFYSNLRGFFK